jgi:hypothetical protein
VRFFTPQWHSGDLPDDEAEAVPTRYAKHIAAIEPRLPATLRELAIGPSLHDAKFGECRLDHRRRRVSLMLRCGDQQDGYSDRQFIYDGVDLARVDRAALASAVEDPETEILYDEVDVTDSRFIHRILFWPYREVQFTFENLQLNSQPRPNRTAELDEARYIEMGAPAV